ncbi:protein phosphatase 2C domain-containing protein [Streptomyces sp. 4N124]|uniref:protein phosphatase 2C domain-containing protein n=1 Tax=Streptomyces sp. 4N124 TaxID=3457420 RepID=UPI003FD1A021
MDFGLLGESVVVRAASLAGTSHLHEGKARQDEYCISQVGNVIIAAVADGLGSADFSHHGAGLAVHRACHHVRTILKADGNVEALGFEAIVGELNRELTELAGELTVGPDRVSTTVVVLVAEQRGPDEAWPFVTARVGDSTVRLLRDDQWPTIFQDQDDHAGPVNNVQPLPSSPAVPQVAHGEWHAGDVIVLLSDGVDVPLGRGAGAVGRELAQAWKTPPEPLQFVSQLSFRRRATADDRTAVAFWRHDEDG